MRKGKALPLDPTLTPYVKAAIGRKAQHLVVLNLKGLSSIADIFMICHGRSNRQVTAIADYIQRDLKNEGIRPLSVEGAKEGHWVLLDYGHVIIHVFYEPIRKLYDLESLWSDAERVDIGELAPEEAVRVEEIAVDSF